ncbi:MAG: hypothetical protein ACREFB_02450 [Stellaceae bacterium]
MTAQYFSATACLLIICGAIGSALAGGLAANPIAVRSRRPSRRSSDPSRRSTE